MNSGMNLCLNFYSKRIIIDNVCKSRDLGKKDLLI